MPTRRSFLKHGVGVPAIASAAGCLGPSPDSVPSPTPQTPEVSFDAEYDSSAGAITITHESGDRLTEANTSRLTYGVESSELRAWSLPVEPSDTATVDWGVESGATVVVVWTGPDGTETQVFLDYRVP